MTDAFIDEMTIPIKTFCQTGSGTTKPPDGSRTVGQRNIPQLVIVPDQTPNYPPQLTASAVWRYSFRGLHKNKNLKLLGLAPESAKRARYTFPSPNSPDVMRCLSSAGGSMARSFRFFPPTLPAP
jgi:hypothetical protein